MAFALKVIQPHASRVFLGLILLVFNWIFDVFDFGG